MLVVARCVQTTRVERETMRATTRGRTDAKNRWAYGSRICAMGENVATELIPGFEWSLRIITLEAFSRSGVSRAVIVPT
jgi:hypothetical protein